MYNFEELQKDIIDAKLREMKRIVEDIEFIQSGKLKKHYDKTIALLKDRFPELELKPANGFDYIFLFVQYCCHEEDYPKSEAKEKEVTDFVNQHELELLSPNLLHITADTRICIDRK